VAHAWSAAGRGRKKRRPRGPPPARDQACLEGAHQAPLRVIDGDADLGRHIQAVAAGSRALLGEVDLVAFGLDPLADEAERLDLPRGAWLAGELLEALVDGEELLQGAEPGKLGGEVGALERLKRVLVLELGHEQPEELLFAQAFGGNWRGGCAGRGDGVYKVRQLRTLKG
jgi:hypothetical protein